MALNNNGLGFTSVARDLIKQDDMWSEILAMDEPQDLSCEQCEQCQVELDQVPKERHVR